MPSKSILSGGVFTGILLGSAVIGGLLGWFGGPRAEVLKPLGDIFLNLLYCAAVPLVFFSLSSAAAGAGETKRLGRMAALMLLVFAGTGVIASCLMIGAVKLFNPVGGLTLSAAAPNVSNPVQLGQTLAETLTVPNFSNLFEREHMAALIVFAILTGLAAQAAGSKGRAFRGFLNSGAAVMSRLIRLVMGYAPIGLAAYFAYLVGVFGPQLAGTYGRAVLVYYPLAFLYFAVGFSVYVYWAGGREGLGRFWKHIWPASLTALGTGSSLAALPANLEAAGRIGIPEDIRRFVLPLGATIHMDGTCLAAILKIAILFALFGREFSGANVLAGAVGAALLAGMVMSGIPGGGFLGEMIIVSLYGFGPEALPVIALLGTLVDPPATMVNSSGDTAAAMLIARLMEGRDWLSGKVRRPESSETDEQNPSEGNFKEKTNETDAL
ncbi:MAG: dicarboxylate/amino acid:cation symporter [Anaerohalosphaeraceae bacterium]